jgi:hypothetical protein
MNPILREIARLRQRVVRVEVSRALLDAGTVGVLLAGAALLVVQVVRRPFLVGAVAGGALLLLSVVIGIVRGARNGRRTDIFLAKWLDLENKLEDRFASSYEFQSANDQNKFSQACVQSTLNLLAERNSPLALPALPVGGGWWRPMAAMGLVVAGMVVFQLARPTSATSLDARRRLRVPKTATQAAQAAADRLTAINNPQLAQAANLVKNTLNKLDAGSATKAEALQNLTEAEQTVKAVQQALLGNDIQLPELNSLPPGPIQDLVKSLNRKDLDGAIGALQKVAANAGAGALSSAETAALAEVLRQLEQVVAKQNPGLTGTIDRAVAALDKGKPGEAQDALSAVSKDLPKAKPQFDAGKAVREMIAQIDQMKKIAANNGVPPPPAGAPDDPTAVAAKAGQPPGAGGKPGPLGKTDGPKGDAGGPTQAVDGTDDIAPEALADAIRTGVTGGVGSAQGQDIRIKGQVVDPAQGPLQHVAGNYQGKTLKQLVSTNEGGTPADKAELKRLVATYSEVVQQRLVREEIPAAYAAPVRRYFDQVRLQAER